MRDKMKKQYKMIRDTKGERGGNLFSQKVYSLNIEFGNRLINENRAVEYEQIKRINVIRANGKHETLTWGEYLKEKRKKY